jgi:hypothetical protein
MTAAAATLCAACVGPGGATACARDCRHTKCHAGSEGRRRRDGRVYCCAALGWTTPVRAYDHVWDQFSGDGPGRE